MAGLHANEPFAETIRRDLRLGCRVDGETDRGGGTISLDIRKVL